MVRFLPCDDSVEQLMWMPLPFCEGRGEAQKAKEAQIQRWMPKNDMETALPAVEIYYHSPYPELQFYVFRVRNRMKINHMAREYYKLPMKGPVFVIELPKRAVPAAAPAAGSGALDIPRSPLESALPYVFREEFHGDGYDD